MLLKPFPLIKCTLEAHYFDKLNLRIMTMFQSNVTLIIMSHTAVSTYGLIAGEVEVQGCLESGSVPPCVRDDGLGAGS